MRDVESTGRSIKALGLIVLGVFLSSQSWWPWFWLAVVLIVWGEYVVMRGNGTLPPLKERTS